MSSKDGYIEILTCLGKRPVYAVLVGRFFAVHRSYKNDDAWTVTHINTGCSVGPAWLPSKKAALRVFTTAEELGVKSPRLFASKSPTWVTRNKKRREVNRLKQAVQRELPTWRVSA